MASYRLDAWQALDIGPTWVRRTVVAGRVTEPAEPLAAESDTVAEHRRTWLVIASISPDDPREARLASAMLEAIGEAASLANLRVWHADAASQPVDSGSANETKDRPATPGTRPDSAWMPLPAAGLSAHIAALKPALVLLLVNEPSELLRLGNLHSLPGLTTHPARDEQTHDVSCEGHACKLVISHSPAHLLAEPSARLASWRDLCRARQSLQPGPG